LFHRKKNHKGERRESVSDSDDYHDEDEDDLLADRPYLNGCFM
jgi:hypothetical protein